MFAGLLRLAFSRNAQLSSVLEAATWGSASVFTSLYLKDIQFSSHGFSLGPVVAGGSVVWSASFLPFGVGICCVLFCLLYFRFPSLAAGSEFLGGVISLFLASFEFSSWKKSLSVGCHALSSPGQAKSLRAKSLG